MKLTLWKDNQRIEAKPFGTFELFDLDGENGADSHAEIGYPIFSRFFLVTSQSGVKSQTLTIDGARERVVTTARALVECPGAAWTFRYTNGYSITLRGPFSAEIIALPNPPDRRSKDGDYELKVDRMQFDAFLHDKFLAYDAILGDRTPESPRIAPSPSGMPNGAGGGELDPNRLEEPRYIIDHAIIPAEPINAFGIPQATMRCLEVRTQFHARNTRHRLCVF